MSRDNTVERALAVRLEENRLLGCHEIEYEGVALLVDEQVFSPDVFKGGRYFTRLISQMDLDGRRMLEIGCGCGITGLYLARAAGLSKVVLTDINPMAVENVKRNAERLRLGDRIECYQSDVFDEIPPGNRFDVVYWNHPWEIRPAGYQCGQELDKGLFDSGYYSLDRFLAQLPQYMTDEGRALLGFGASGDLYLLYRMCIRHGFFPVEIRNGQRKPGEFILYELEMTGKRGMSHAAIHISRRKHIAPVIYRTSSRARKMGSRFLAAAKRASPPTYRALKSIRNSIFR